MQKIFDILKWSKHPKVVVLKACFMDALKHYCGVVGVLSTGQDPNLDVSHLLYMGLIALQHRGQECAGIVVKPFHSDMNENMEYSGNDTNFKMIKAKGLISHSFTSENLSQLKGGQLGLGHTRYSTQAGSDMVNCQPFIVHTNCGQLALAHNGELMNAAKLRNKIQKRGVGLSTSSDSELISQILSIPLPTEQNYLPSEKNNVGSNKPDWKNRIIAFMQESLISYSLLILHENSIWAVRDPFGNRPLCIGKIESENCDDNVLAWVIASESCAFGPLGGKFYREILPGEIVQLSKTHPEPISMYLMSNEKLQQLITLNNDNKNQNTHNCNYNIEKYSSNYNKIHNVLYMNGQLNPIENIENNENNENNDNILTNGIDNAKIYNNQIMLPESKKNSPPLVFPAFCLFEYIYFARSDSIFEGQCVYTVRYLSGQILARESSNLSADVVCTIPDSATPAALGFARESGIPYMEVLTKNPYIGRTFIQPSPKQRKLGVSKKFGVLTDNVKDKRIVLIDDSIVRGTTMKPIIKLLKDNGALEVHVRISSPPVKHPCFMGINIPTERELIANQIPEIEKLALYFGANSIAYLSLEGLINAIKQNRKLAHSTVNSHPFASQKDTLQNINHHDKSHVENCDNIDLISNSNNLSLDSKFGITYSGYCTACFTGQYPLSLDW